MNSVVGYAEEPYMYSYMDPEAVYSKQPKYCSKCGFHLVGDVYSDSPQYNIYTGELLNTATLMCPQYPIHGHDRWVKEGLVWEQERE